MKYNIFFFIALAIITVFGTGCKKWLDVSPKTEVRERALFQDEIGFKDALIGVYQHMGSEQLYGRNLTMGFLDGIAQRYNASSTSHMFYHAARYNYADNTVKSTIAGIWSGMYTGIANLNNILAQIDAKKATFTGNNFNMVKGEALALRAYLHFDLLRMFGASPAADLTKKSIPYVTRFDLDTYPLLPLKDAIDSCLKDLAAAEALLAVDKTIRESNASDLFLSYTRSRLNYWAVKGLQARIHLYAGDKVNALAAAMVVIDNQPANFPFITPSAASAANNRDRTYARENLFSLTVYKLQSITEALTKTSAVNGSPTLIHTTSNIETLFEKSSGGSTDIRLLNIFNQYPGGYATSKYWQDNITLNSPAVEYLRNNVPLIRLSEIFYIAAESAPAPAEGVAYLNAIRTKRGLAALATTVSESTLQAEILKEYKKETYAEGQLFYYFKRKNAKRIDGSSIDANYVFPLPEDEIEFGNRF